MFRNLTTADESRFLELQMGAFKGLEYLPRMKVGLSALDRRGSFLAEQDASMMGCVGLLKLDQPRWFEIRNLALRDPTLTDTAKSLINHVVAYVEANNAE